MYPYYLFASIGYGATYLNPSNTARNLVDCSTIIEAGSGGYRERGGFEFVDTEQLPMPSIGLLYQSCWKKEKKA